MTPPLPSERCAGVMVPLFSIPSEASWGIGEIGDLVHLARWCDAAGCSLIQLLPITEMPALETSPYSALSAMAIDPQFISLRDVADFQAIGGEASLDGRLRGRLASVRAASRIDYVGVRALKGQVLRRCFERFTLDEDRCQTPRALAFHTYAASQGWWLDDYAVFRALRELYGGSEWMVWPEGVRSRIPDELAAARADVEQEICYRKYLQWLADEQWAEARRGCGEVRLLGDMPFMVSGDSADVWGRQDEFRMDVSVGVPPDAFSASGQDWKLPLYRWEVFLERDFEWLRHRARRYADLYDGYRVDHLVGFYRTFFRPHDGSPAAFAPAREVDQVRLGERVLSIFRDAGATVIAEDLGVIPDFVRESLARLRVPGYKVFRWERLWHNEGQPFIDPSEYPVLSEATSGTHDTEPMVIWWEKASEVERAQVLQVPSVRQSLDEHQASMAMASMTLDAPVLEAILVALYNAGSMYLILPIGDIFAWRERINQPATVGPDNWTWRLPWPSERLRIEPEALDRAARLSDWSTRYRRVPGGGFSKEKL